MPENGKTPENLKDCFCNFCGAVICQVNCEKICFPMGEYLASIWFQNKRYIDVQCGACKETTTVRNPRNQFFVDIKRDMVKN